MSTLSPYTVEFMLALPAKLRPNPHSVDEEVMMAVQKGWKIHDLAEATYVNDRNPNPAFVVTNVRKLCLYSPVQTKRPDGWGYGHLVCDDHAGCELCRCVPGVIAHHKQVPMPEWFKAGYKGRLNGWGEMPDA